MKNTLFILTGGLLAFTACQSDSDEPSSLVDYAQLPEIGIELVIETGESAEYLPGRMSELALTSDGSFLVSDSQTTTLEQYSADGEHLATVAREGDGPGELPSSVDLLLKADGDTLIGRHFITGQHDYFGPGSDGTYRYIRSAISADTESETGRLNLLGSFSDTEYYAYQYFRFNLTDEEIDEPFREVPVLLIDERGGVAEDSLNYLRLANGYTEMTRTSTSVSIFTANVPYRNNDQLLPMDAGRYLIARPFSSTITFYDNQHQVTSEMILGVAPRPVTDSDLEYHLQNFTSSSRRSAIEDRVPEIKPPFLDLWATNDHILLLTDEQETHKEIVVYTVGGDPLGRFNIPEIDVIQRLRENRLYTIHRNQEVGDRVRVYELDI